jgi:hypothetical protein
MVVEIGWRTAENGCCLPCTPCDDDSLPDPSRRRVRYGPRITAGERRHRAPLEWRQFGPLCPVIVRLAG